jgi:hypothetical protein
MARVRLQALFGASILLFASCSGLFNSNLFGSMDHLPTPSASRYSGPDWLDLLAEDLASKAFIRALVANPSVVDDIEALLISQIGGTVDFGDDQQAVTLLADLYLRTTGGEQFVNAFSGELIALMSSAATSTLVLSTTLTEYAPTEARAGPTAFAAFVQGLLDSNDGYLSLGRGITDTNSSGMLDSGDVATGVNVGDAAGKAIVAFTIRLAVEDVKALHGGGATDADAIGEMYNLLTGSAASAGVDTLTVNSIANPTIDADHASSDTYLASTGADLQNLVECAGFGF